MGYTRGAQGQGYTGIHKGYCTVHRGTYSVGIHIKGYTGVHRGTQGYTWVYIHRGAAKRTGRNPCIVEGFSWTPSLSP